ncbi:GNAT family N-acetyltransferase [Deinococcus hopiensis]|nr:GNAT family N-acetyltransferase [Deinococcus hopiensis]
MTPPHVLLREVRDEDIRVFYEQQLDLEATQMAAFPSRDWPRFSAHWARIRQRHSNELRTIEVNGEVAGNMESYEQNGRWMLGYWLGRAYWGQGVATRALQTFLAEFTQRPVFAQVAKHNVGSQRVLEKNGFRMLGEHAVESDGFLPAVVEVELILESV